MDNTELPFLVTSLPDGDIQYDPSLACYMQKDIKHTVSCLKRLIPLHNADMSWRSKSTLSWNISRYLEMFLLWAQMKVHSRLYQCSLVFNCKLVLWRTFRKDNIELQKNEKITFLQSVF